MLQDGLSSDASTETCEADGLYEIAHELTKDPVPAARGGLKKLALQRKPASKNNEINHELFGRVKISLNTHKSYVQCQEGNSWKLLANVQHGLMTEVHQEVCRQLLDVVAHNKEITTKEKLLLHRDRLVAEAKAKVTDGDHETAEE